jgi:signal transduction histidine kinase
VRLTAVFALAMSCVLAGAALFVYLHLRADLDEAVNASLAARADAVAGAGLTAAAGDPEEYAAAIVRADGSVAGAAGLGRFTRAALVTIDHPVAGLEGSARVLARPQRGAVVVVAQSLDDRDEALAGLLAAFAIGGPVAVLLASLLGYALATAALRPVEAMRRRAASISLTAGETALPLPAADDEIRRLGETLNEMLERLRRTFERERRFVADASHELRTPIAVVKTELEALLRIDGHSPEVRAALLAAADEVDQLARLAEDLLVLTRAAEGRLDVRPERIEAGAALDGARIRFAARAAAEGRSLALDVPAGTTLLADPLRLRQALDDLVDNALRHGAGDITLAARALDGGTAIDVLDGGDGLDGVGDRAFERFARGDDARTRGGAGLGLAIVRAIAEAHGGRAEIVGGARVRIWLPSQAQLSARPQR